MAFTVSPTGTARTRGTGSPTINTYVRDEFLDMLQDDITDVFIQPDNGDFAITVSYKHRDESAPVNYPAIFDNPNTSVNVQTDADFNSLKPQLMIKESELKRAIKKDDTVEVKGNIYFVENYISDGVGVTTVYLRHK